MTTLEPIAAQLPPLHTDEGGTVRVAASRVTLDTLIHLHRSGASPEEICSRLPSLALADVYGALRYYLEHRASVDAYLDERSVQAETIQQKVVNLCPPDNFHATLLARREATNGYSPL